MVHPMGIEPTTFRQKPDALPLSYERAFPLQKRNTHSAERRAPAGTSKSPNQSLQKGRGLYTSGIGKASGRSVI